MNPLTQGKFFVNPSSLIIFAIGLGIVGFGTSLILLRINRKKGIYAIVMFSVFICICFYYLYLICCKYFCGYALTVPSAVHNIKVQPSVTQPIMQTNMVQSNVTQTETKINVPAESGTGPYMLVLQIDDAQIDLEEGKTQEIDRTCKIKILDVKRDEKPTGLIAHVTGLSIPVASNPAASNLAISQAENFNDIGYEFSYNDLNKKSASENKQHMYKVNVYAKDGGKKICEFFIRI